MVLAWESSACCLGIGRRRGRGLPPILDVVRPPGPANGMGLGSVPVLDEALDLVLLVLRRPKVAVTKDAAVQDREPDLDLIALYPFRVRSMAAPVRSVDEADPIGRREMDRLHRQPDGREGQHEHRDGDYR